MASYKKYTGNKTILCSQSGFNETEIFTDDIQSIDFHEIKGNALFFGFEDENGNFTGKLENMPTKMSLDSDNSTCSGYVQKPNNTNIDGTTIALIYLTIPKYAGKRKIIFSYNNIQLFTVIQGRITNFFIANLDQNTGSGDYSLETIKNQDGRKFKYFLSNYLNFKDAPEKYIECTYDSYFNVQDVFPIFSDTNFMQINTTTLMGFSISVGQTVELYPNAVDIKFNKVMLYVEYINTTGSPIQLLSNPFIYAMKKIRSDDTQTYYLIARNISNSKNYLIGTFNMKNDLTHYSFITS